MINHDGYMQLVLNQSDVDERAGDILVSQSLVGSYDLCAAALGQKGKDGYIYAPNQQMSWGSMVHAAIEDMLDGCDVPDHRTMRAMWDESLLNERDGSWLLAELCDDEVKIRHWVDEAVAAAYKWRDEVLPTLDLDDDFEIEHTKRIQIGTLPNGRRVFFGGTADLWEPGKRKVTDWKTSGSGWHQTKADYAGQVAAYLFLFGATSFRYAVWNRAKLTWDSFDTTRTQEQIESYLKHAYQVAVSIDAGVYPVRNVQSNFGKYNRSWQCSPRWCGAWNICPFKYLNDDKWEQQVADPREGWK